MEESKQSQVMSSGVGIPDMAEQERRYKARINNNSQFMRTQAQVFGNISSVDRMIAYSLNQNCMSLSRVKHQQVLSLITNFNTANMKDQSDEGKKVFTQIIKNRFNPQGQQEEHAQEEVEEDFDMDEEDEGSEEDDESERMSGNIVEDPVEREARPRNQGDGQDSSSSEFSDEENQQIQSDEEEL